MITKRLSMRKNLNLMVLILLCLTTVSCFDPSKPNYQFFPNMYESVGYGTYDESDAFNNGIDCLLYTSPSPRDS